MRLAALITMAAVGTGAWAAEAAGAKARRVTVCMKGDPGVPATWPAENMVWPGFIPMNTSTAMMYLHRQRNGSGSSNWHTSWAFSALKLAIATIGIFKTS